MHQGGINRYYLADLAALYKVKQRALARVKDLNAHAPELTGLPVSPVSDVNDAAFGLRTLQVLVELLYKRPGHRATVG